MEAAIQANRATDGRDIDRGDEAVSELDGVHNVHRISIAEHKVVHRLRATAVARFADGAIDQDFITQLARVARRATTPTAQEEAAREAKRGAPNQVFFARALAQTFHYMVSSGIEYGYLATARRCPSCTFHEMIRQRFSIMSHCFLNTLAHN